MTTEQKTTIEQLRSNQTKSTAQQINMIAKQIEGAPVSSSCFCSRTAFLSYLKDFYNWFDTNYPNEENNVTNE